MLLREALICLVSMLLFNLTRLLIPRRSLIDVAELLEREELGEPGCY